MYSKKHFKKYINKIYGRLKILKIIFKSGSSIPWARCKCICGNIKDISLYDLKRKNKSTKSCGCLRIEMGVIKNKQLQKLQIVHGESFHNNISVEYDCWRQIKQRVFNPRCKAWKDYGGRGIKMLYHWAKSFIAFITWIEDNIGRRPGSEYSIDRIDNDLGYYPGNLKWSTKSEQQYNRRICKK